MKRRLIAFGLALTLTLPLLVMRAGAAEPDVSAPSAILMEEATGEVLYEKNAHERLAPASVTKILTLLLVMEALESGRIGWDDTVAASAAAAAKGGSQIYLEENEQLPLEEMLKAVVVSSANDCATALAEHIAGSESAFVQMMNERAAEHLTTAYDIALMSRELLKHEEIKKYTTIWMDTVRNGEFGLSNTNKLVRFYDGTTGLKTGYTSAAGHCLSASAKRGGMELIAVVLHCDSSPHRFESAKALLNYGFANYALITPQPDEAIGAVPVRLGTQERVTPVLQTDAPVLVDKALAAGVQSTVQLAERVTAPVEQGQTLGMLTVASNGQTLAEIPLVAPEAIPALTWWDVFLQMLKTIAVGG